MITISLCMILKNEEDVIGRCLDSIKDLVDEIIIVDTGSTDNTLEILKKYDAKVYNFKWVDDFSKARNYSFSKATMEYMLWLDADDVLLDSDRTLFKEMKENLDKAVDVVAMNYVLSRDEQGKPQFSMKRNRLLKRGRGYRWDGRVHEYVQVYGNIVQSDISISHMKNKEYTDRNLRIYESMKEDGVEFSPREQYYYANELFDHGRHADAIDQYELFLDGKKGWVEDNKAACMKMAECYNSLGDIESFADSVLRSFKYDKPRADACCKLAYYFIEKKDYKTAAFWYKNALECKPEKDTISFVNHSLYTWIPLIQLCVCYSNLGDFDLANYYNEEAAKYIPNHRFVTHNRGYLKDKISK